MSDNNLSVIVYNQQANFEKVCSVPSIQFEREAKFALQVLQSNDFLATTALKNQNSLINAINNVAAIGISLNPAEKHAYLVPRDGRVCLDISYMGMMYLAQDSGAITWAQAIIVRDADTFELNGIDRPPTHKFNPFATDRGEIVGVYVVVKTSDGDYLTHAMPISAVYAIRDRSQSWKAGKSTPWKSDPEEMIKKTCVKQASKYWPERQRLSAAVHHMDTDGGEGLDFTDGNMPVNELEDLLISIREALNIEILIAARKIAYSEVEKFQDAGAKKQLIAAVNKRYAEIKPPEGVSSNG